jgi:hypothetical protein
MHGVQTGQHPAGEHQRNGQPGLAESREDRWEKSTGKSYAGGRLTQNAQTKLFTLRGVKLLKLEWPPHRGSIRTTMIRVTLETISFLALLCPIAAAQTDQSRMTGMADHVMSGPMDSIMMRHMEMTPLRKATQADSVRAKSVAAELKKAIAKYQDTCRCRGRWLQDVPARPQESAGISLHERQSRADGGLPIQR